MNHTTQEYYPVIPHGLTALRVVVLSALVTACSSPATVLGVSVAAPLESMAKQNEILARNVERALCPRDVAWVVRELRRECAAAIGQDPTKPAPTSPPPSGASPATHALPERVVGCPPDATSNIDELAHDLLGQGLFKTLQAVEHEVLYFEGSQIVWSSDKQDRLAELIALPPLEQTRFLFITPTDKGESEADERIAWMQRWLTNHGVPRQRVDTPLKYQGNRLLGGVELRPLDRPVKPEPSDPARALWVYRISCR